MYYRKALSAEREMATYRVKPRDRREHNRKRMKALAEAGCAHGILAYEGEKPVGWCAYGRKSEFPQIDRGRAYRKLPPAPEDVWRIVCFVVAVGHRRKGVASATLRAALESIRRQGGGLVEAYPAATPEQGRYRLWFGTRSMFQREGFQEVAGLGSSVLVRKILPSGK
jgi:GNAT superfamily N-acetyltransferase